MDRKNIYNNISRIYDLMSGSFESSYRKKALTFLSAAKGESILEIGFGTGQSLIEISRSVGIDGMVTAVDKSQSMFEITDSKLKKLHLDKNVNLFCEDARFLTYEQNSYDAIFMSFTLEIFTPLEISPLLKELYKSLKPNGRVCILSMAESEKKSLIYKLYLWAHKRFPHVIDCRPINVQSLLDQANFKSCITERLKLYGLPVDIVIASKN